MTDVFSPEKRSAVMSSIKSSGNRDTELALIALFRRNKITGWRRKWPVFGKPDFVFPRRRLAVFVDGCFWHGCPTHATQPRTNSEFWFEKLTKNRLRDRLVSRTLRRQGWSVLRIWEHELHPKNETNLLRRVKRRVYAKEKPRPTGTF